jgi:hypothetical protein
VAPEGRRREETRNESFWGMGEAFRCIYVEEGREWREGARGKREEAGEERNKRKKDQDNVLAGPEVT